jgi:hypothetical protein
MFGFRGTADEICSSQAFQLLGNRTLSKTHSTSSI